MKTNGDSRRLIPFSNVTLIAPKQNKEKATPTRKKITRNAKSYQMFSETWLLHSNWFRCDETKMQNSFYYCGPIVLVIVGDSKHNCLKLECIKINELFFEI